MRKQGLRVLGCKKTHPKSSQSLCRGFFVCRWFGVATSKHKQFILTHKDTFSRSHLTKQPTGNRTDTSLSTLRLPFSEIATPAVIKPGSRFLCFCCLNSRKGFWVRTGDTVGTPPHTPPPTSAGSRKSALPLPPQWEQMQKWRGFWWETGRSQFSIWTWSSSSSSLLLNLTQFCCFVVNYDNFCNATAVEFHNKTCKKHKRSALAFGLLN